MSSVRDQLENFTMIKRFIYVFLTMLLAIGCGEPPVEFTEEALNEQTVTLNGEAMSVRDVLDSYKGKTVLIDVWASWCGDCISGMPTVKQLQKEFPDVEFLFLSVDRNIAAWKRGIQKYAVNGNHYFLIEGQKGAFGDFLNSNWIPRYMVIDPSGTIKLYKAKKATDSRIKEALQ